MSEPPEESLLIYTHLIYGLQAVAVLIGVASAASIVGSFLVGVPSILAVILNYARRSEARGTLLESHFRWQIRTFWYALLLALVVVGVSLPLMLVLVGFATLWGGLGLLGLWLVYRVARGWLALADGRPMYAGAVPERA